MAEGESWMVGGEAMAKKRFAQNGAPYELDGLDGDA